MPKPTEPFGQHIEAMRYSLFAGGKRIRPILCLAAAKTISEDPAVATDLMPICCALECIHTYSLIHDDLPAMDDDDLRRGKPTNHILFGEAGAILAGDGLLTLAFELICSADDGSSLSSAQRLKIAHLVAKAAGSFGMVGGQALDIAHEKQDYPFEMLQTIHRSKTGALITASVHCGAVAASANSQQLEALLEYGRQIGLAFQIVDDLLNVTATTAQLGKQAGNDEVQGKATYPAFCGIEETSRRARLAVSGAKEAIADFDSKAEPLRLLADYVYERSH
ncbi:MAG: polyprenyl synthetase family protein [Desulfocapsaceae bacterium]|nr:polyprenyl synthetase family protein [Desulfocapsaceae bacterium]